MLCRMTLPTDTERLAEALASNAKLKARKPELAELADQAARATNGRVYYAYTTVPEHTEYYVFSTGARCTYNQAEALLNRAIANPGQFEK
jgi:hypothetical protein